MVYIIHNNLGNISFYKLIQVISFLNFRNLILDFLAASSSEILSPIKKLFFIYIPFFKRF